MLIIFKKRYCACFIVAIQLRRAKVPEAPSTCPIIVVDLWEDEQCHCGFSLQWNHSLVLVGWCSRCPTPSSRRLMLICIVRTKNPRRKKIPQIIYSTPAYAIITQHWPLANNITSYKKTYFLTKFKTFIFFNEKHLEVFKYRIIVQHIYNVRYYDRNTYTCTRDYV